MLSAFGQSDCMQNASLPLLPVLSLDAVICQFPRLSSDMRWQGRAAVQRRSSGSYNLAAVSDCLDAVLENSCRLQKLDSLQILKT